MFQPYFSVIVPVYNTNPAYLKECLQSVLTQSFRDFELIVVDDGSEGRTANLLDRLTAPDARARVIHMESRGISAARNCGIESSHGKWIVFCDSDDWLEPSALTALSEQINLTPDTDVIWYRAYKDYDSCRTEAGRAFDTPTEVFLTSRETKLRLYRETMQPPGFEKKALTRSHSFFVWDKCFRRAFLTENKICFPENLHVSEDQIFFLRVLRKYQKIARVNCLLYHYRQSAGSTVNRYHPTLDAERMTLYELLEGELTAIFKEFGEDIPELRRDFEETVVMTASNVLFKKFYHPDAPKAGRRHAAMAFLHQKTIQSALWHIRLSDCSRANALRVVLLRMGMPGLLAKLADINRRRGAQPMN